jgi:hemerythrin-like domain-containing protein
MRPTLQPVAPSIDDPIELLIACHDKVRRFTRLAERLRDHVALNGADTQAREAAQAVLRYFDIAAPLHHDDEDLDLFPALREHGTPALRQALSDLSAEHESLGQLWHVVRAWLQEIERGHPHPAPDELAQFAQRYVAHAAREEAEVYPHANQLSPAQTRRISQSMVARRTAR